MVRLNANDLLLWRSPCVPTIGKAQTFVVYVSSLLALTAGWDPAVAETPPRFLGPASCATANCHGGVVGVGPPWRSSARVWESEDPHANAGWLLLNEQSRRIVERLEPAARVDQQVFDQVLHEKCVSCHATGPGPVDSDSATMRDWLLQGVSCEACHGPAAAWLNEHVHESFRGPDRFKLAPGMRNQDSWLQLVAGCARCHVGSRHEDGLVRDVNHDLIAAGHPALRFDATLYYAWLPRHWAADRGEQLALHRDAFTRHLAGRYKLLEMAAELSRQRMLDAMQTPNASAPFPEFADFDCWACHRDLTPAAVDDHQLSRLAVWNSWYTALLPEIPDELSLLTLQRVLETDQWQVPQSHLQKVVEFAGGKAQLIEQGRSPTDRNRLREWLAAPLLLPDELHAAQWYLQAHAGWLEPTLRSDESLPRARAVEQALREMAVDLIQFGKAGEASLSPAADFQPSRFESHRQRLLELLE